MDFYARQEAARRTSRWLLFAYLLCVIAVVAAIDVVVLVVTSASKGQTSPLGAVTLTTVVVLAIILGSSLFKSLSLRAGGGVVARTLGATRVERSTGDISLKRLHNVVEEMAIASGVTMPEVYVLESEEGINALAAGHSPADAAVIVTRGAATQLKREELQGVIAHEFSHILNGDTRLYVKLMGLTFGLLAVAIVARIVLTNGPRGGRGKKDGGAAAIMLAALAAMIVGYIGVFFGRMLQAAVSRNRERLADASAVQFTRNPLGLTGALLKVAGVPGGSRIVAPEASQVAHMLFAPGLAGFLRTHPPIEERLLALDKNFKKGDLPARAAEAARDAERLIQADSAFTPRDATQQPMAGVLSAFPAGVRAAVLAATAQEIAASAGSLETQHVRYAESARLAIPEALREFVDSGDHARSLVLAMLISRESEVANKQGALLARVLGNERTAQVLSLRPLTETLAPNLRLPAVQQLFPALRRLPVAEREQLRDLVAELAAADARIDVFECCMGLLLATNLQDELEGGALHGSASLEQEAAPLHALFAILAAQGNEQAAPAAAAYAAGMNAVLPQNPAAFEQIEAWPQALSAALERLAMLKPMAKKTLIEGLVRCVAHDEQLSVEEGELLRTVCSVLHCPLPPIVAMASDVGGS